MNIFDYEKIPPHMLEAIDLYVIHRVQPGGFLRAVLENDLRSAVEMADNINIEIIPIYVAFLVNKVDGRIWGSVPAVRAHLEGNES